MAFSVSMTSDCFGDDIADPRPVLKLIAEAGFPAVHGCHDWDTQRLIGVEEIDQYWARPMGELGLEMPDLHASDGRHQLWSHVHRPAREWGLELVKNRLLMASLLGCRAVVLHAPLPPADPDSDKEFKDRVLSSMAEITRLAQIFGVRIALENTDKRPCNEPVIDMILDEFSSRMIGLGFDTGHANIHGSNWAFLQRWAHRVYALHVHDNLGPPPAGDLNRDMDDHLMPGRGGYDWETWTAIMADSIYDGQVTLEVGYKRRELDLPKLDWLRYAHAVATDLHDKIMKKRTS